MRQVSLKAITLSALVLTAVVASLHSQVPASKPSFEVTSVKPNLSGNGFIDSTPGGRFVATGVPLRMLMTEAYGVRDFQIVGGPGWMNTDRWDVEGKPKAEVSADPQTALMVQSLIEERFQLKFHRAIRELPVYELTVAKGGTKMKLSAASQPRGRMGRGSVEGSGLSLANFIKFVSQQFDRPLIDKTDLKGIYDIKLQWNPALRGAGPGQPGAQPPPPTEQPDILTAIQEQLGLKLESSKGPVEVIVIDSVQRPTDN